MQKDTDMSVIKRMPNYFFGRAANFIAGDGSEG
jgi:hypothetical protein